MAMVIYRRRWRNVGRKTYWVYCWQCDYREGPYPRWLARIRESLLLDFGNFERPWCNEVNR
jgi:hypothetical protein